MTMMKIKRKRMQLAHGDADDIRVHGHTKLKDSCFWEKVEGRENSRMERLLYQLQAREEEVKQYSR